MAKQDSKNAPLQTAAQAPADATAAPATASQAQPDTSAPAQAATPSPADKGPELAKSSMDFFDNGPLVTSGGKSGNGTSSADLQAAPAQANPADPGAVSSGVVLSSGPEALGTIKPTAEPPGPKKRFRVLCHPPTPIKTIDFTCDAVDATHAWELFLKENGISGTEKERDIFEVDADGNRIAA